MMITESIAIETAEMTGTGTKAKFSTVVGTMTPIGAKTAMVVREIGRTRTMMPEKISEAIEAVVKGGTIMTVEATILTELAESVFFGAEILFKSAFFTFWKSSWALDT